MASHICPQLFTTILNAYQKNELIVPFLSAGIFVTCMYYVVFVCCNRILLANPIISMTIAYFSTAMMHFLISRHFVFKAANLKGIEQFFKYTASLLINYGITFITLRLSLLFTATPYIGLIIASGLTTISGYLILKLWVFKHNEGPCDHPTAEIG